MIKIKNKKNICVITGSRAEYGILRWILEGLKLSDFINLQLIVTGMHLSPEYGSTINNIEKDGYLIDKKIEILLSSDSSIGVTKSIGVGLISFADAFAELKPDLVLIVGDRFEIFSVACSALVAKIPIAHIHGGESTQGAIDEAIRHSITKMSHLHFVATEKYRNRVIQLGEQPENVFNFGSPSLDNIEKIKLLTKKQLEKELNLKFNCRNLLITFHPATLESISATCQFNELLEALKSLKKTNLFFTMPNADTEGKSISEKLKSFCLICDFAWEFVSLGQLRYLSLMKYVDGVIGNSSSGIIEAPTLKIGTINIGDRQKGRVMAKSIINVKPNKNDIKRGINLLFSDDFQNNLSNLENPYGSYGASTLIVKKLEEIGFSNLLKKEFFDIDVK